MEAMMALRQELYLLRDASDEERDRRTRVLCDLGLALHRCNVRRHFRGHEARVRVVAAGLLAVAADRLEAARGGVDEAPAGFWRACAEAQFGAWKRLGACGHPGLLAGAAAGWERCAELGLAADGEALAERAEVQLLGGDFGAAAATLGALVEQNAAPSPARRVVILRVAMLYQHALRHHAQAVALIFRLAAAGGVAAFNNADLLFLMARCYLEWSRHAAEGPAAPGELDDSAAARLREGEAVKATAAGLFAKLFHSLTEAGAFAAWPGGAPPTVDAWLDDARTWRALGDKCAFCGLDLYAADLYEEGARRDPRGAGRAHWYRLAKVQRKCGRHDLARGALNCAIDRAPGDAQLRAVARLPNPSPSVGILPQHWIGNSRAHTPRQTLRPAASLYFRVDPRRPRRSVGCPRTRPSKIIGPKYAPPRFPRSSLPPRADPRRGSRLRRMGWA